MPRPLDPAASVVPLADGAGPTPKLSLTTVTDPLTYVIRLSASTWAETGRYADLSDFFYVWLRRTLKPIYPDLFATLTVPKAEELVATPHRHGGKDKAEAFLLAGMTKVQADAEPAIRRCALTRAFVMGIDRRLVALGTSCQHQVLKVSSTVLTVLM